MLTFFIGTPPLTSVNTSCGVSATMKIFCLGDAFEMMSMVCCSEKKRVATPAGAAIFMRFWRMVLPDTSSLATRMRFAPRVEFHWVATWPWIRRLSMRVRRMLGSAMLVRILSYTDCLLFRLSYARGGRRFAAARIPKEPGVGGRYLPPISWMA